MAERAEPKEVCAWCMEPWEKVTGPGSEVSCMKTKCFSMWGHFDHEKMDKNEACACVWVEVPCCSYCLAPSTLVTRTANCCPIRRHAEHLWDDKLRPFKMSTVLKRPTEYQPEDEDDDDAVEDDDEETESDESEDENNCNKFKEKRFQFGDDEAVEVEGGAGAEDADDEEMAE